jgi:hypothetical protein
MINTELLKSILILTQEELHDFLVDFLLEFYKEEDIFEQRGNFIYVKGDIPVLMVAHLDTVHTHPPIYEDIFYDQDQQVMWSPHGIGGDDRCGVYQIMELLLSGYRPCIAFTWNEEVGALGAQYMTTYTPLTSKIDHTFINFAIQIDRRGFKEAVYYDLDNAEFERYISGFGFDTKIGSYSDISEICPAWGFAGVNVSAGYTGEHTLQELILVYAVADTLDKVKMILGDQMISPKFYEYKERKWPLSYKSYASNYYYDYYDDSYDYNPKTGIHYQKETPKFDQVYCDECYELKSFPKEFSTERFYEATCNDCYKKLKKQKELYYCAACAKSYTTNNPEQNLFCSDECKKNFYATIMKTY